MEYLTVKEAATELGVSEGTIRNWLKRQLIEYLQVEKSHKILIPPKAIGDSIRRGKIIYYE